MADLKLLVLGQPRLERDGTPIELNLRKGMALLAYLAVSGQPHSRDALATLLWPESDGREGRARLRRTLHRLTQAVGDSILESTPETLRLASQAGLWLDSAAFRQHSTAGLAAAAQDICAPERLAHLNAAVAIYTADFLAGFTLPDSPAFDEWQFFQRESLRQLYGQVLEQLIQAYRAQQDWAQAIVCARQWVALDTLHEPAHRMLMWLYAWSGQPAAALRQYQECARILDAELGVEPEDETTALYEGIRTRQVAVPAPDRQPLTLPAGEAQPHQPHPRQEQLAVGGQSVSLHIPAGLGALREDAPPDAAQEVVFVAREQELARLGALLEAALAGHSGVAFVVGEAGQGKTALLQAFAQRAQRAYPGLIVAGGNCNAYTGTGDPYLPFREILGLLTGDIEARSLAGRLGQDHAARLWQILPAAAQALLDVGPDLLDTFISARRLLSRASAYGAGGAAWLADLQALAESKAAAPIDPQQHSLFEQYAKVAQALAQRAPLLLILDDLQWADPGSTDLLLYLGRQLKGSRVLIVGAYRPVDVALGRDGQRHPLERVLNELRRDFGEIVLDLGRAEGRAFVDALLDSEPNQIGEAFRATLYRQTGGHPLFTIELLRDLQERGALARDGAGRWVAAPSLDWSSLPARVDGAIGERVGRLDERLREMLQVASVEGEEFTAEVVARVLGANGHDLIRQLSRELDQTHHLVQAIGVRRAGEARLSRYRFQHILTQRYLYGSLDEVVRAYYHEAVGHALEQLYGPQAGEAAAQLAWHFEMAQLPAKAARYNDQAGDRARHAAAFAEAARSYRAALDQWPAADQAGRAGLLRKLGECQWLTGHLRDALATFEDCHALYESLGDWEGAGAVQRLLGRLYWEKGDRERSLQHYYRALALLEQGPESAELARTISSISEMHMIYSDYDQALSWGQRALSMAERLDAEHVVVQALVNLGSTYFATGDAERGQELLRRSWRRAVELNLPHDACRAAYNLGTCLTDLGMPAEARAVVEELRAYAARMQVPLFAGIALITLVKLDWLTGCWRSALARRQEVLEWISRGQSITYLEVIADTTFAWMHNDLGQADVARRILEQAQPKVAGRAEVFTTGSHLGQHIRALGMLGFDDEAAEAARRFLALMEQQNFVDTPLSSLTVCRWFAGRAAGMRAELSSSLAQIQATHAQYGSPVTAAALSEGRGLAALSEGEARRAVEYAYHAAAQWQALGRPYDQARARAMLSRAWSQAGAAGEARIALDQALRLVDSLAAQLDAGDMKAAFLASPLVQELRGARLDAPAAPPRTLARQPIPAAAQLPGQQIRFGTSADGVRIAYATIGAGPVLVKAANWLSHLEFDWNSPVWRHWLAGLSQRHTLARYDERGCGLSDWDVDDFSIDAWVRDLETVVDALGLERFPLLALSQGGPVAITYAVRHPERVSHLILYGSYARGWWRRALSPQQREETEALLTLSRLGWGRSNPAFRQVFTSMFIPDATTEQMRWFNDLQRISTSPENAVKFLRAFYEIDVTDLAPKVAVPTLVLHAYHDARIPFAAGRELAALIPNARFVPLESQNHILLESEPAWQKFLDEVHSFVGLGAAAPVLP